MDHLIGLCAALADRNRVRALLALRQGELCVCQITALLNLAPSTVSKHMSVLKQTGLVRGRKRGRWMHYRRPGRDANPAARDMLRLLDRTLADDPQSLDDTRRLARIIANPPEDMCKTPVGS
ncbi:MAG: metalloregulator ArsR/SmtB family transcription factor [Chitinivibrionales bacterium]|nr:metalloregulator ArsR/SmtB family transcription factor [Chitinivibrionales bacterium]